ncbi:S8 family peptidase [Paenibacillus harenae]|uniref:S8 family peptidase n=1 Tax=Paenibacillus harenae TaxID=306543 RepID=UPI0027908552|nr:S8 family peptidase [Paenibacillus harenae]MDQ0058263.1 minor extracellular protease Epr [Paenibacillus harenae]
MSKLESMIRSCAANKPSKKTARHLITLRTRKSYNRCLKMMKANGITPFKAVPRSLMIGFHVLKRASSSAISSHPEVRKVEKDLKIKIHAADPDKVPYKASYHAPYKRNKAVKRSFPLLMPTAKSALITWNINRVNAPQAWTISKGSPMKVAVIDTGIANHPDLRIAGGVNTINGGSYADDNGHGTHVAGIISAIGTAGHVVGVAPEAELYAVKALDANGEGYVSDIVEGIDWCIGKQMNVINMSLGITGSESSGVLHDAVRRAVRRGIVIVASAGNSGESSKQIDEPAAYEEVIAVAASTKANQIASFSSRGKGIAITAPGQQILSTWLGNSYKKLSGTSMSSPHVAGGAALLLSRKSLSPTAVSAQLRNKAIKLDNYSALAQGAGLMQLNQIFDIQTSAKRKKITGS